MKRSNLSVLILAFLIVSLSCSSISTPIPSTSTPEQTATQPPSSSVPLAGLVYYVDNEEPNSVSIWQIDDDNKSQMLLPNHYFGMLSPDGTQFVYYDIFWNRPSSCTWLMDFKINETQSLDCSANYSLPADILGWIPNKPNILLAILEGSEPGMGPSLGVLGTISLENGDKEVLDSEHQIRSAEISPDGNMIAYAEYYFPFSGWLYSFDSGAVAFNPQDYGISSYSQIGSPAWSPDGTKIVWGLMDNELNSAIGVFDLDNKTASVLHPFKHETLIPDSGPTPPSSIWSSDGNWLIVGTHEISEQFEWWVLSADGKVEYKINGTFNSQSPDGKWLVTVTNDDELNVSRLDGSETVNLGEVNYAYDGGDSVWSKDSQYLAFIGTDEKIRFAKAGEWEIEVAELEAVSGLIGWNANIPIFYEESAVEAQPTATPQPVFSCPNAPRTRLKVGDSARITFTDGSTTRLRSAPEAGNNGVDNLPEGTEFEIIGGPVCYPRPERNDAYVYWEVSVPSRNVEGWIAEGDLNSYYIEPLP